MMRAGAMADCAIELMVGHGALLPLTRHHGNGLRAP
jgi:hypothetical protein